MPMRNGRRSSCKKFDPKQGENGDYVEFKLADDEELNTETLNALKNSLDELKIVDVKRKAARFEQRFEGGQ